MGGGAGRAWVHNVLKVIATSNNASRAAYNAPVVDVSLFFIKLILVEAVFRASMGKLACYFVVKEMLFTNSGFDFTNGLIDFMFDK